jgi:hypothetical protein
MRKDQERQEDETKSILSKIGVLSNGPGGLHWQRSGVAVE